MRKDFHTLRCANIYFDEELDALFLHYTSKVLDHEEFLEVNTLVLEASKTLNTTNFVADIRSMGIIAVESQLWVAKTLLPEMIKHLNGNTLWHAQLIDSKEVLSKVSGNNIKRKSENDIANFELVQYTSAEELKSDLLDKIARK